METTIPNNPAHRNFKWRNVYSLALLAALFTAIFKAMDNITVHNFAVAPDQFVSAATYLVVGGWMGTIIGVVLSLLLGKRLIDPNFTSIQFKNGEMHKQAALAGTITAVSTLFLLWGNQKGDAGTIIALGNAGIIYNVAYDVLKGHVNFRRVIVPTAIVLAGVGLVTYGGSFWITAQGILLVVLLSNGVGAFSEVVEQKGVRSSDGVNFYVWRFLWLAVAGTIVAFGVSYYRGQLDMLMSTIRELLAHLPWLAATMFFVFWGIGFKLVLKKDHAISTILLIMTVDSIFGYPITWIGNQILPGAFGELSNDPKVWATRFVGAIVMLVGIYVLWRNDPDKTSS